MDYEKAYNEMVQRVRELHDAGNALTRQQMEIVCPELAESEDERIRKSLINFLSSFELMRDDATFRKGDFDLDAIKGYISYLEKQKENPKSAVEVLARAGLKPYKDGNQWCILAGDNIQEGICGFGYTIDEALYQFLMEVLEKQKEQKPDIELIQRSWYMEGYRDGNFGNEPKWIVKTGKGGPRYEENPKYGQLLKEQKPAWSEEDKEMLDDIIRSLLKMTMGNIEMLPSVAEQYANRLKSLRPSWKPSKEQMKALSDATMRDVFPDGYRECLKSLYEQLKKL